MKEKTDLDQLQRDYPIGKVVKGIVTEHKNYGIFLTIGHKQVEGHIPVTDFIFDSDVYVKQHIVLPYPPINSEIEARVTGYAESQIWLTIKPLLSK